MVLSLSQLHAQCSSVYVNGLTLSVSLRFSLSSSLFSLLFYRSLINLCSLLMRSSPSLTGTHPPTCFCNRLKMKLSGLDPPTLVPLLAPGLPPFPPPEEKKKAKKTTEDNNKTEMPTEPKKPKEEKGKKKQEESPSESSSSAAVSESEPSATPKEGGRAERKKKSREERRGPRDLEKEKQYAAAREKLYYMSKVRKKRQKENPFLEFF